MTSARAIRVLDTREWRLPGCDGRCWPRAHSPEAHEEYGYQRGLAAAKQTVVQTGPLTVDLDACVVTIHGEIVSLSSTEWSVLAMLARQPGAVVSARDTIVAIWGEDAARAPMFPRNRSRGKATLGGHNLRVVVARLRSKLGPAARLVQTRPQLGYCLTIVEPAR